MIIEQHHLSSSTSGMCQHTQVKGSFSRTYCCNGINSPIAKMSAPRTTKSQHVATLLRTGQILNLAPQAPWVRCLQGGASIHLGFTARTIFRRQIPTIPFLLGCLLFSFKCGWSIGNWCLPNLGGTRSLIRVGGGPPVADH